MVKSKVYVTLVEKSLGNLKAAVRAVKLSVVVNRGTYGGICSNYRIMEVVAQCRPEVYEISTSLPNTYPCDLNLV